MFRITRGEAQILGEALSGPEAEVRISEFQLSL